MIEDLTREQLILIIGAFAALLTALGPIMTTLGAAIGSWVTARRAAKKEELERLRDEMMLLRKRINKLESENNQLRQENLILREYISTLRIALQENGIDIPPLRDFDESAWLEGVD